MTNNYSLAKKIVLNKYNKDNPYYPLFVVGLYALLNKYPDEHLIITEIFNTTNIHIEKDTVQNTIKKYNYKVVDLESLEISETETTYGVSSYNYSFHITEDNHIKEENHEPFLICNAKDTSPTVLLNVFIHEMNHLIKGYYKPYKIIEKENEIGYYIRSGINYYWLRYFTETDILYEYDFYSTLDEIINTLQTTEMMKFLKQEKDYIPDNNIYYYLDNLNPREMEKDFGYEVGTELIRPLWEDEVFKELIEDNLINGDINKIIRTFDRITSEGSFVKLADTIDDIDELDALRDTGIKYSKKVYRVQRIINRFSKKEKNKTLKKILFSK